MNFHRRFWILSSKDTGAFFGVGDGEEYPQLHTENYCFPDDIIAAVLDMYERLTDEF